MLAPERKEVVQTTTVDAIQVWTCNRRRGATQCVIDPVCNLLQFRGCLIQCHEARRESAKQFFDAGFVHGA